MIRRRGPEAWVSCARSPSSLCVARRADGGPQAVVFTALDPVKGRGAELARFDIGPEQRLGPMEPVSRRDPHRRLPEPRKGPSRHSLLARGNRRRRSGRRVGAASSPLAGRRTERRCSSAAALPGAAVLLHVDLQGNAHVLWQQSRRSLDGRALPLPTAATWRSWPRARTPTCG